MTSGIKSLCRITTSADGRIVADHVRQQIMVSHSYKHSRCMVPLPILVTSVVARIVDDYVRQQIVLSHPYKQYECVQPLSTFRKAAKTTSTADGIWHKSLWRSFCKQPECMLQIPTLLTSDDGRTVGDEIRQEIIVSFPYQLSECLVLGAIDQLSHKL